MANTKKTVVADKEEVSCEIVQETAEIETKVKTKAEEENEALKEQLAQLQAQMKLMAEMITNSANAQKPQSYRNDRPITFVNMTNGTIVLRGSSVWKIEKQFETRTFTEGEARIILNNMPNAIRSGAVYIADSDFVAENNLIDAYTTVLSDEQLKGLFDKQPEVVVETYKNASDLQKDIIIGMIEDKLITNSPIDSNIVISIGKLCGRDLINTEPMD